ncbi:arsenate reductase [Rhizobium sp. TH2]|uniref:arsenate reductase n=1 Tax=Rhizobium sp. TH2 TaxID=2775403 RepID=UPI002157C8C3|nr:arsenate reductase [Rhizobium sp. TH2]UVC09072.1 arsenate reductase [Rhizobium sp. TH2]
MTVRIYGIKNCDTMKKAFDWLKSHGIAYDFHDYRAVGIDAATVKAWCDSVGWEKVLNKASTTFKELPDADKVGLNEDKAIALMAREPTMIKRPVLIVGETILNGFKPAVYEAVLKG